MPNALPPETAATIATLYRQGLSAVEVGSFVGCAAPTVYRYAREAGVPIRPRSRRTTPDPIIGGRRNCRRCRRWRHICDFSRQTHRGITGPSSLCLSCMRSDAHRATWERERLELRREYDRIRRWSERRANGAAERVWVSDARGGGKRTHIDVEPIAHAVNAFCDSFVGEHWAADGITELSRRSGIAPRRIFDYRDRKVRRITLSSADKLAIALGLTLDLLYDRDELEAAVGS